MTGEEVLGKQKTHTVYVLNLFRDTFSGTDVESSDTTTVIRNVMEVFT